MERRRYCNLQGEYNMKALNNAYYIALSFHIPKPDTRAYSVYL